VTRLRLAVQSAAFFWRAHLLLLITAALSAAILTGALLVGDSVRNSLTAMALERLGAMRYAVIGGDRFFRDDLAERLAKQTPDTTAHAPEPLILIQGIATADATNKRAGEVQIVGVREGFWAYGSHGPKMPPKKGEVVLNGALAKRLSVKAGDGLRLRIYKPSQLSHDAPLGSDEDNAILIRVKVSAVIPAKGLGRFGFSANQAAPLNAYLPLEELQAAIAQPHRANILMIASKQAPDLQKAWSLDDAQLKLRTDAKLGFVEVTTPRVFLDDALCKKLLDSEPGATGVTTYFVNALRVNGKETPYSMVAAGTPPLVPAGMKDDEILLNTWAADDLGAKAGDKLEMEYFTVGTRRRLSTNVARFNVRAVVPIEGQFSDRGLMPEFPGIADVDTTHDWDSSIPIDMGKIRKKDDEYWKQYRGTPKAFIALPRGVELWKNRFGSYTGLRFPLKPGADAAAETERLRAKILATISPGDVGLSVSPVRELALRASSQALDFGGLFIGFSFFLIAAALLLLSLVFRFSIDSRASEMGLLLALGFTPKAVQRTLWLEGTLLAAVGSIAGALLGSLYARAMIENLGSRWQDAVGTTALQYRGEPLTLAIGGAIALVVASITVYLSTRGLARASARDLMVGGVGQLGPATFSRLRWGALGAVGLLGAIGLGGAAAAQGATGAVATLYFGAGGMLLLAALALVRFMLGRATTAAAAANAQSAPTLTELGMRAATRRAGRSAATAILLACGTFLVLAVGANRLDASLDAADTSSGTGGFALIARSTIPVFEDLNSPDGRANAGVSSDGLEGVSIHPLRVRGGDEASCLNLNRAQRPRIVGVPKSLVERGGFTFAAQAEGDAGTVKNPWTLLNKTLPDAADGSGPEIPAIGDFQSLTWALGLQVGDTLSVPDEKGKMRTLRIVGAVANSILQGSLLIAEDQFMRLYPTENGYREFLIDAPYARSADVAALLEKSLSDEGFIATPAAQRLAEFNAVQNTYLSTFQALGGLGMLLGSFGLGLVVLRNVLERRGELALMRALGFSRAAIRWLVFSEHAWLLALGLLAGILPALLAIVPASRVTTLPVPWFDLALMVCGIALFGSLSALLAVYVSLRGRLLSALRNE
jgi:putative ABC transport system permease protein